MRILFIVPPYRTTDGLTAGLYPLPYAATLLAAVLRDAGHEVAIEDFLLPVQCHPTPAPACFAGLHAPRYMHFGRPLDNCKTWLDLHAPDFDAVGLCLGQCNLFETGAALAQHVRSLGIPLVVGGAFATTAPEEALRLTGADVLVTGEAEGVVVRAFADAVAGRRGIIPGVPVTDLATLPLPAWDLTPPDRYPRFEGRVRGVLSVTRGCPLRCRFCSVHTVHGRAHRRQKPDRIRAELLHLWGFGVRYFAFVDDNLLISPAAVDDLLGVIEDPRATVPGFDRARFYVEEGIEVRIAAIPGLIARLVAAGFEHVALGVETMSGDRRREAGKPYDAGHLEAAVRECKAAGIVPRAFYVIGFPGDTVESVARDLVAFGQFGIAARPNNLKLYPGTDTTRDFIANGWIDPRSYDWRLPTFYTPPSRSGSPCSGTRKKTSGGPSCPAGSP